MAFNDDDGRIINPATGKPYGDLYNTNYGTPEHQSPEGSGQLAATRYVTRKALIFSLIIAIIIST